MPAIVFVPDWPKFEQIWRSLWAINRHPRYLSNGTTSPKWGPKSSPKGEIVRHGHRIYHTPTKIYPNMSVHSTTYATQYVPQPGPLSPFWGHKPQKKGNDWPSATRIIAKFLWRSCIIYIKSLKTKIFAILWLKHTQKQNIFHPGVRVIRDTYTVGLTCNEQSKMRCVVANVFSKTGTTRCFAQYYVHEQFESFLAARFGLQHKHCVH